MEVMADTLRNELAPFHVRVVSIVTTAVKSKTQSHYPEWKPENSYYGTIKPQFDKRARGDDGAPRMDTTQYADGVVSIILKGSKAKFFYGASAAIIRFVVGWLPPTWLVSIPYASWSKLQVTHHSQDGAMAKGTGIDIMTGR
jgi:1-acylglycerone phosphate reductase